MLNQILNVSHKTSSLNFNVVISKVNSSTIVAVGDRGQEYTFYKDSNKSGKLLGHGSAHMYIATTV